MNFFSIAVDVRSLGWLTTNDRAEYERYQGFVHTLRAAIQAYLLPEFPNPALAREAARYLASGPTGEPIFAPATATVALATGQTETWVADRTGHKSSTMINRYRRAARMAAELNLGSLQPLDEAIPELSPRQIDTKRTGAAANAVSSETEVPMAPACSDVQNPGSQSPTDPNPEPLAPRAALIVSLTTALRDLLLQGDHAGAGVALTALRDLLALDQLATVAATESGGVRDVVHLDLVRKDAGR